MALSDMDGSPLSKFRVKQHQICKEYVGLDGDEWDSYLKQLSPVHFMIILLLHQETSDEVLHKQYLSLSHGRLCVEQIAHELK